MFGVSRSGLVWLAGRCLSFSNAGAGFFSFGGAFPCTIVCGSVFSRPVQLYMTLLILFVLYIRILLLVRFVCMHVGTNVTSGCTDGVDPVDDGV